MFILSLEFGWHFANIIKVWCIVFKLGLFLRVPLLPLLVISF